MSGQKPESRAFGVIEFRFLFKLLIYGTQHWDFEEFGSRKRITFHRPRSRRDSLTVGERESLRGREGYHPPSPPRGRLARVRARAQGARTELTRDVRRTKQVEANIGVKK